MPHSGAIIEREDFQPRRLNFITMSEDDPKPPDALDWTPQQALQRAIEVFNGTSGKDTGREMPDGVLIIFHYEDGPMGESKPKRSYFNSGMSCTQVMAACNFVNQLAFSGLEFNETNSTE